MEDEITPVDDNVSSNQNLELAQQSTDEQDLSHNANAAISHNTAEESSSCIDHLVVLVHGMKGSEKEWIYVSEQFAKEFPDKVFVHRSKENEGKRTYDGVDVMGERLAKEVIEVIQRNPHMRKISFIAYSIGGLVARYAIGRLYNAPENEADGVGTICGLMALNFITLASPHLGSIGHKQVPIFFGKTIIEKVARILAPCQFGNTGRQLFLSDGTERTHPLLIRMARDTDECSFISALRTFECRVVYSNVVNNYIVGWRTASIRDGSAIRKYKKYIDRNDKYPHIVYEEDCHACDQIDSDKVQENMVRGLSRVAWKKVDVSFNSGGLVKFQAHSLIQVKYRSKHIKGADVIQHMIDHFVTERTL